MAYQVIVVSTQREQFTMEERYENPKDAENMVDDLHHALVSKGRVAFWDTDGDYVSVTERAVAAVYARKERI